MRALVLAVVTVGLVVPVLGLAQSANFETAQTFAIGGVPGAVAVIDIDHDDHLDVLTTNADAGTISVLPGDGTGELLFGGDFFAGTVPTGLGVGDFTGDGDVDAIVSNANVATISFLEGFGDTTFDLSGDPIILLGFCNGDPATACDPNIRDGQQRDQCTVAGKGTCNAVSGPNEIAVGRLNADAFLDLAVASQGDGDGDGTVNILFGLGNGTFTGLASRVTGSMATSVAIGDVNKDGRNDVVVGNEGSGSLAVFLANASGGFGSRIDSTVGTAPAGIGLGDVNGDGRLDVVAATQGDANTTDGIVVLTGDGQGHFTRRGNFPAGNTATAVVLRDMNDDDRLDAVVSNSRSIDASILFGDGAGAFATSRTFVASGQPVTAGIGDLNEDGRPDVVSADSLGSQQGDVAVLLNEGNGRLLAVENFQVGDTVRGTASGDLDNDGLPDLAITYGLDLVRVYLAREDNHFAAKPALTVGEGPSAVALSDLNRDGNLDLVTVNTAQSDVSILLGNGDGTFQPLRSAVTTAQGVAVVIADLDNNRRPDIVVASIGEPGVLSILRGNGDGTFQAFTTVPVGNNPVSVAAGLFNGDAFADLVVANSVSDNVSILLGNGTGSFSSNTTVAVGRGPVAAVVLDANRDGFDDFAVAQSTDQNVWVLKGNGTGAFERLGFPVSADSSPSALVARDVSGDGRPDLVVANQVSNNVSLLIARVSGTGFSSGGRMNVSRMPVTIAGADFDGNGRYDAATGNASPTALNLSVLSNQGVADTLWGDGNGDGRVSAADLVAAQREVTDGDVERPEDAARKGYSAGACVSGVCPGRGVDGDGDGVVSPHDTIATAIRIFIQS